MSATEGLSSLVGLLVFLAMVELISLLDAGGFAPPQVVALAAGILVAGAGLVTANQALVGGALADMLRATDPPGLVVLAYAAVVVVLGIAGFTRAEPRVMYAGRVNPSGFAAKGVACNALLDAVRSGYIRNDETRH